MDMLGEVNIVTYDDKAILDEYMREKEERRKLDRIKHVNDSNKNKN